MLESAIFVKRRSALFKRKGIDGIIAQAVLVLCLAIVLLLTMLPLLVTLVMSVKTPQDITQYPMWTLPKSGWMFSNYANALNVLIKPMLNTVIIDLVSTVVTLFISCFVAYLFEKKKFPGRKFLFLVFIAPMLVPSVVVLSPTYIVVAQWLHLKDNWLGLILPYIAGNQIASVFLLRTFMSQQPDSLYEAAKLDGASTFKVFMHICLPLSVPIMMVQGINIFAAIYNDYLWPQLLFQADLTKGVLMPYLRSVVTSFTQGVQYAMYLVAGIPLIITTIISIKFFVNGDFASGMKL